MITKVFSYSGSDLGALAVSQDGTRLYVIGGGVTNDGLLDFVNSSTGKVIKTTSVGSDPDDLVVSSNGKKIYVTAGDSNTLTEVDTKSGAVTNTYSLPLNPDSVAIQPSGSDVIVAGSGEDTSGGFVTLTSSVSPKGAGGASTTIPLNTSADDISFAPDGSTAYVLSKNYLGASGFVYVLNTATNRVTTRIRVQSLPSAIAVTPDGKYVLVADEGMIGGPPSSSTGVEDSLSVIDAKTNRVVKTIKVGVNPDAIAISPNSKTAYVADYSNAVNTVSIVNLLTLSVAETISGGPNPSALAITPDGRYLYVSLANALHQQVNVINTSARAIAATVKLAREPGGLAVAPSGDTLYITEPTVVGGGSASPTGTNVGIVSTSSERVSATVTVGTDPSSVVVTASGKYALVLSERGLAVIRTSTHRLVETIVVPSGTSNFGISPNGKEVYLLNSSGDTVQVIRAGLAG